MAEETLALLTRLTTGRNDFVITILLCEILYIFPSRPRTVRRLPAWVLPVAGILLFLVIGFHMPMIPAGPITATINTLFIFALSLLIQKCVLEEDPWRILFYGTSAYATQNLALNLSELLVLVLQADGWWKLLLHIGVQGLTYLVCYFLFARKARSSDLHLNKGVLIQLLLITIFVSNFLFSFFAANQMTRTYIHIPLAICCMLTLQLQFTEYRDGNVLREKEILEQLLFREQKRHELMQETIDIINIKSHDLRKQVQLIRRMGALPDDVLLEVESAVNAYDAMVDTGSHSLDLIILEEKLLCEKHHILMDVMADGKVLDFIPPADLYSLIGNGLRNAVEHSLKESEQQRSITLNIHQAGGYAIIQITNYCTTPITFVGGMPKTGKDDKRFHGYGLKSMEYVVKKYGGNMVLDYHNNVFMVKIIIPLHHSA